jgi:hypothetical protein
VDESELACCMIADTQCSSLLTAQTQNKRAEAGVTLFIRSEMEKRELVDENELACCLISDPRCSALL